jgi:hypothetical protein
LQGFILVIIFGSDRVRLVGTEGEAQIANKLYHAAGDHLRTHLDKIGSRAGKAAVDGAIKNLEPTLEVFWKKRRFSVQQPMDLERISAVPGIIPRSEEHRFPKISDDGEVMIEIELRDVRKNVADDVVLHRLVVKIDHQRVDILSVLYVFHSLV